MNQLAALEKAYNPRVSVPDFEVYAERREAAIASALTSLPGERDVRYGSGPRQLLDIFHAGNQGKQMVNIFFHGGFWRALNKDAGAPLAAPLLDAGIVSVSVGYDLCPDASLDRIVAEACEAVSWVHANIGKYGGDPENLILSGTSAGAHLAAMVLGLLDPQAVPIRGACLVSGIYDIAPVTRISVNDLIGLDDDAVLRNSPMLHLPRGKTELLVAYGTDETPEWCEQSRSYARAARQAGCAVREYKIEGAHHFSTGLATAGHPMNEEFLDFMKSLAADGRG